MAPKASGGWLTACSFLCLVDRTDLSVAAINIQRDLGLNNSQLGLLLSSFFFAYAAFQLLSVAGWVADRFNVCWVLGAGFLVWSCATMLSGVAHTFAGIFAMRRAMISVTKVSIS